MLRPERTRPGAGKAAAIDWSSIPRQQPETLLNFLNVFGEQPLALFDSEETLPHSHSCLEMANGDLQAVSHPQRSPTGRPST